MLCERRVILFETGAKNEREESHSLCMQLRTTDARFAATSRLVLMRSTLSRGENRQEKGGEKSVGNGLSSGQLRGDLHCRCKPVESAGKQTSHDLTNFRIVRSFFGHLLRGPEIFQFSCNTAARLARLLLLRSQIKCYGTISHK